VVKAHLFGVAVAVCLRVAADAAPAQAWGRDGHKAVCHIAWEQLTEVAKNNILDLLNITTEYEFANACLWADEVKAQRPETAGWHGFSMPMDARTVDLARDCPPPASCVVEQVARHAAVLQSDAPPAERAEALKFLAHLVGDLHQPMNITLIGNLPSDKISGMFLNRPTTLRAVWDDGLIHTVVAPGRDAALTITDAAAWTGRLFGANKKTPLEWATETMWVALTPATGYLNNRGGDFFDERYIRQNRPVAFEQIDRAGVRLADLLNDALK
jgi:hypothetical protein